MPNPKDNDVVSGPGNSQYAAEAGEGPVTEAAIGQPMDKDLDGPSVGLQEGGPTIQTHDLGNEGFAKNTSVKSTGPGRSSLD